MSVCGPPPRARTRETLRMRYGQDRSNSSIELLGLLAKNAFAFFAPTRIGNLVLRSNRVCQKEFNRFDPLSKALPAVAANTNVAATSYFKFLDTLSKKRLTIVGQIPYNVIDPRDVDIRYQVKVVLPLVGRGFNPRRALVEKAFTPNDGGQQVHIRRTRDDWLAGPVHLRLLLGRGRSIPCLIIRSARAVTPGTS